MGRSSLLFPNHGRRLGAAAQAALARFQGDAPDVQLVVGDGLSPNAIVQHGAAETLAAMQQALAQASLSVGPLCFVKYARIAVADEIAVLTRPSVR